VRYGRRLDAAEVERLSEMAITDPLTGLRNHRAFHEDVARELQRAGRTGVPLALVLLDVDGLKAVNDTQGHQAGDERLQALAEAIRVTGRGSDVAYRVGGDEFAVILPDARTWGALEFAQRLRAATQAGTDAGGSFTATAGISEALTLRSKDELVREADLALIGAKRIHQDVVIYGPDLAPAADRGAEGDVHHTRTLASALARAVDAKDSYTRSHCQTVSQLCGLIGAELGFDSAGLTRLRLAGLLHDVGKIGVPDEILNKPAKLTEDEYEQMKRHSLLGYDIVEAADMAVEARWVRHHHERFDGGGYPDGLAGEEIPLESRVILVADAFEAMTSDRPYRQAPGQSFAIVELGRNAGTQFDPAVVEALTCVLARAGEIGHVPAPSAATA
jgi:diguanylate cyclase (GGDEF)-like protein